MARPPSTLALVLAGTLAVHALIVLVVDVATVVGADEATIPIPKLGLVDVDLKQLLPPEPPKAEPEPEPEPAPQEPVVAPPTATPPPKTPRARPQRTSTTPPPTSDTPPPTSDAPPSTDPGGGGPVVALGDIAPAAKGVPAGTGKKPGRGGPGRGGGEGDGDGAGVGSGSGPPPVSIAAIKTPAKPRGDFDYLSLGKDYPAEAKRLGVEGELKARLVVDARGKVTSVRLLGSLGHGLDELAAARARKLQFDPAKDANDQPVPSVVVWTFTFTLPS